MTRSAIPYAERTAAPVPAVPGAIDVSEPVAGFYKIKLSRDTVLRAVRVWNGPPLDPITGEELDRSWRWQANLDDGALIDLDRVWPQCARDPITEAEFRRCCARVEWARQHAPASAWAERGVKLDPLSTSTPMPF